MVVDHCLGTMTDNTARSAISRRMFGAMMQSGAAYEKHIGLSFLVTLFYDWLIRLPVMDR